MASKMWMNLMVVKSDNIAISFLLQNGILIFRCNVYLLDNAVNLTDKSRFVKGVVKILLYVRKKGCKWLHHISREPSMTRKTLPSLNLSLEPECAYSCSRV